MYVMIPSPNVRASAGQADKALRPWRAFLEVAALLAVLTCCATAPYTGRSQIQLYSQQEEYSMGAQASREVLQKGRESHDAALNERVRRIGQRIAAVADMPGARWEFHVMESKEPNAFCLPGGKVFVYTGIVPMAANDDELATVMGHEIAHALARHGTERVSQSILAQIPAVAGSVFLDPQTAKAATSLYTNAVTLGVILPYSRTQESEADRIGLILMAKAGYNPDAAVHFWQTMARKSGSERMSFLSTHPATADRIRDIQAELPEARSYYRAGAGR